MSEQIQIGGKKQLLRSLRNELDQMKNKLNQTLSKLENISDMDSTQSGGSSYTTESSLTESNVYSVNDLLKGGGDLEFEIISNQQGGDEISSCSSSSGQESQAKGSQGGGEGEESSAQEGGEESSAQEGGEESSVQEGGEESLEEESEELSEEEEESEELSEEGEESSEEESQGGGESEISMTTSDTSSLPSYINNAMRDILEDKYSKDQVSHKSGISIKDLLKNKMNI